MDLASLFSALQSTQQAKTTVRLSERNVIELVNKLKQLGVIGDDLLHTINGKEFITTARLKQEVNLALKQAGGRLSLVELPALLGVDLIHCERQAAALVAESDGTVTEAQGELMTTQYFESISAEINDLLQEMGQLSVADLALQYSLATELLLRTLTQHLGTTIQGRLESGLLYTPAAMRRLKAQLRGALRGVAQPSSLPAIAKELGLEAFGASTSMLVGLVEELVARGEIAGTLRSAGTGWLPASYASAQQSALTAFYEQNSWIGYDMARKLGFSSERAHLARVFPTGVALDSAFVHPTLVARVQSAVEEALAAGGWVDVAPLLPSALTSADIAVLLQHVPQLAKAAAGARAAGAAGAGLDAGARVVAGTCVVSGPLLAALSGEVAGAARAAAGKALAERKVHAPAAAGGKTGTGQGGKGAAPKASRGSDDDEDWSTGPRKGKAGGKAGAKGGGKAGGKATVGKADPATGGGGGGGGPGVSVAEVSDQLLSLQPDMEGAGEEGALVEGLAQELLPAAVSAWESALAAAFTAGAESRRQAKDALSKAVEEAFTRLCAYSSGLELFAPPDTPAATAAGAEAGAGKAEGKGGKAGKGTAAGAARSGGEGGAEGDDGTWSLMERHVVRTAALECVDLIFKWVRIDVLAALEGTDTAAGAAGPAAPGPHSSPLTAAERGVVSRASPPDVVAALQLAAEAAAASTSKAAVSSLEEAGRDLGLRLRRLDKKSEKAAVTSVRSQLMGALASEQDAAAALALLVPLLFIKATGRAILLPGKAIGAVLSRISKDLPEDQLATVHEFHSQVVEYLKACSAPGGAPALAEALSAWLPTIKGIVGLEQ